MVEGNGCSGLLREKVIHHLRTRLSRGGGREETINDMPLEILAAAQLDRIDQVHIVWTVAGYEEISNHEVFFNVYSNEAHIDRRLPVYVDAK